MLDVNTFSNLKVINFLNKEFINLKIDAESKYGMKLFSELSGTGYPMIMLMDSKKNEIDRFYGYYEPEQFIAKITNILQGDSFPNLIQKFNAGDNSSETMALLARKYAIREMDSLALALYKKVLTTKNVSYNTYHESNYFINLKLLDSQGYGPLENYINEYPDSPYFVDALNQLLAYFKITNNQEKELLYLMNYLDNFLDDPWFLNQFSWRMTELNINLNLALDKINLSLSLLDETTPGYANILDTKAEVLWKMGNIEEAVQVINKAINMDTSNGYYIEQKNKFHNSIIDR